MMKSLNCALLMCTAIVSSAGQAEGLSEPEQKRIEALVQKQTHPLTEKQKNVAVIAAYAATGDMQGLRVSLERGLDAGLSVSDCREILVQLYAYAGFPRSLNALNELMQVADARRKQGKLDDQGHAPTPVPAPEEMLAVGTRNQTVLVGSPVKGALFDFAPATDQYLKAHLFGAIFSRDNFDWKNRELATIGALAAMTGVESQLKSHVSMSINVGLSSSQLSELIPVFKEWGEIQWGQRLSEAMKTKA